MAGGQHPARHDSDVIGARDRRRGGIFVWSLVELDGGGRFVFALRSRHRHPAEASYGVGWRGSVSGGRFVLPRWLRRPARIVERLRVGDYDPPPFAATMASAVLFAAAGIYGAMAGGHADAVVQAVTSRSGFAVADVRITGNQNISDIDILQEVGLDGWTSLVGLDVSDARERIAALPWVE